MYPAIRPIAVSTLALALFACAARPSAPGARYARPSGPACYSALAERGAEFTRAAPPASGDCRVSDGVSLIRAGAALDRPAVMDCRLALALDDFERRVLNPAAARHLGQTVTRVRYIGAYSCRRVAGQAGRMSEHAYGRAIDIAGFDFADGTTIMVKDHWRDSGARSRFLAELARGACAHFSVVLTPNSDRDHRDHLHFDIGPNLLCSP